MTTLSPRQSLALAASLGLAADTAADPDTAATLLELTGDLVNHANGHLTWLAAPAA